MKPVLASLALLFSAAVQASPMTAQFTNQASAANRPYLLGFTLAVVCIIVVLLIWTRKR